MFDWIPAFVPSAPYGMHESQKILPQVVRGALASPAFGIRQTRIAQSDRVRCCRLKVRQRLQS